MPGQLSLLDLAGVTVLWAPWLHLKDGLREVGICQRLPQLCCLIEQLEIQPLTPVLGHIQAPQVTPCVASHPGVDRVMPEIPFPSLS